MGVHCLFHFRVWAGRLGYLRWGLYFSLYSVPDASFIGSSWTYTAILFKTWMCVLLPFRLISTTLVTVNVLMLGVLAFLPWTGLVTSYILLTEFILPSAEMGEAPSVFG